MAKSAQTKKAIQSLVGLGVIILTLAGLITAGTIWGSASWAPKLALDLEGGTEIILAPKLAEGETPTQDQLNQAVSIIRQRVDSSGVSEAEVNTQGGRNIVVSLPGTPTEEQRDLIRQSAKLEFRAVLYTDTPATSTTTDPSVPESISTASPTAEPNTDIAVGSASPTDTSDLNWVTEDLKAQYDSFDCSTINDATEPADPSQPLVTCDDTGQAKYLLGPVEQLDDGTYLDGETLTDAEAGLETTDSGATTNTWVVNIEFDKDGTKLFEDVTSRITSLPTPQNQFAIVLDNKVITAPASQAVITNGKAQISGSFTQETAQALADQLKFGALPMSFDMQSENTISATLGTEQLKSGLIAGLIGLLLVVAYSVIQYRALGGVTVMSLVVAALLAYLMITFLSWRQGYRLSLAGVAGLIVAIGITADSFIVYFERIRDELREGRILTSAVENGWKRALRTILASDAVNFLAAIVLYILAVGSVRGFAFTLGLTTIIDLLVVWLFTHPVMQLLSTTRFFGEGHHFSGLDPRQLGATYRGRGSFAVAPTVSTKKRQKSGKEAARRQTIAERKAAEAKGQHDHPDHASTEGKED